ncbi:MAG: porin PorA family protein [Nitrosarchaeum sp.]|nr:porin PorA family protein [Nitrosarchaeum sp.]
MLSNEKIKLIVGFLIILSTIVLYELSVSEIKKMPLDYQLISEHEGQDRILDHIDGNLSEPFLIRETLRQNVIGVNGDALEIKATVVGIDPSTNNVVFNSEQTFSVDRISRKHSQSNDYFAFPPNVQKQNYEFVHPMIFTKTTFVFDTVSKVGDLDVYDFSCKYSGTDVSMSFPQFPTKKILSDGKCKVSVEPITGIVVYFSKQWDDYFVDDEKRGAQVELGGKQTTEYSKSILVSNAKSTKSLYSFFDVILPILITLIGVIILLVMILFEKTRNQTKMIIQAQSDLIKKEKLSIVGELTARISHDLRNPLSVIKLTVDNMESRISKKLDPKLEEYIPVINDSLSRINYQINQVLGFVKPTNIDMKLVSILKILEESIKNTNIPNNVSLTFPKNDFSLIANKVQLEAAFSNLLSNSVDAIGENNGNITIRARNEKDQIILEFEDSGIGIPKENLEKIFEPLFTTKQRGTGLGLASVKSIIDTHGGTISVKSPPTVFTITLPQNHVLN